MTIRYNIKKNKELNRSGLKNDFSIENNVHNSGHGYGKSFGQRKLSFSNIKNDCLSITNCISCHYTAIGSGEIHFTKFVCPFLGPCGRADGRAWNVL
jgi:hypothetical protein